MGADVVKFAEGSTEALRRPGAEVPSGSESRAGRQWGSPGTWEALPPPQRPGPRGDREKENPWPAAAALGRRREQTHERKSERYRQAKATKCGGKDGRESERLGVLVKPGNRPAGTRWREGDAGLRSV